MEKFRIGNDLSIFWAILGDDGQPYPLSDKKVRLFVTHPRGRMEVTDHISIENGHVVVWNYEGSRQRYLGTYKLTVEIYSAPGIRVLRRDIEEAFGLVSVSLYEDVEAGKPDINETGMLTLSSVLEVVRVAPVVPQIGANGNWFVEGEDTGKPARGQAGSAVELAYVSVGVDDNMELGFDYVPSGSSDNIEFELNEEGELVAHIEKSESVGGDSPLEKYPEATELNERTSFLLATDEGIRRIPVLGLLGELVNMIVELESRVTALEQKNN